MIIIHIINTIERLLMLSLFLLIIKEQNLSTYLIKLSLCLKITYVVASISYQTFFTGF